MLLNGRVLGVLYELLLERIPNETKCEISKNYSPNILSIEAFEGKVQLKMEN